MQHFVTPETAEYILNLNTSGLTTKEIYELTGFQPPTLLNYLKSAGLKPNCSKLTLLQRIKLRYAFDEGMNEIEAAKYAGISQPSISKHYKEWGL
jgi:DNA-binding CsgD family transcriptional regulator